MKLQLYFKITHFKFYSEAKTVTIIVWNTKVSCVSSLFLLRIIQKKIFIIFSKNNEETILLTLFAFVEVHVYVNQHTLFSGCSLGEKLRRPVLE